MLQFENHLHQRMYPTHPTFQSRRDRAPLSAENSFRPYDWDIERDLWLRPN